ncbi:MAG: hypothetical protein PGN29_17735 [Gordonia paraffinivorans]
MTGLPATVLLLLAGLLAVVIAFASLEHRQLGLAAAAASYVLVPSYFGARNIGPDLPVIYLPTLIIAAIVVLWAAMRRLPSIPRGPAFVVVNLAVLAFVLGIVYQDPSAETLGYALNQVLAPFALFVLAWSLWREEPDLGRNASLFVLGLAAIESVVAVATAVGLIPQPYLTFYERNIWWGAQEGRFPGTMDHPLVLGMFLAMCVPLIAYVRSTWASVVLILLLSSGIALTQSRIAVVGGLLAALYVLVFAARGGSKRVVMVCAGAMAGVVLTAAGAVAKVQERIVRDRGSTIARQYAWDYFGETWRNFIWSGVGNANQKSYFEAVGLTSSGESALVCLIVSFGLLLTVVLFAAIVLVLARSIRWHRSITPGVVTGAVAFVSVQFFSSIGNADNSSGALWIALALAVVAPRVRSVERLPGGVSDDRRDARRDGPDDGHRARGGDVESDREVVARRVGAHSVEVERELWLPLGGELADRRARGQRSRRGL